MNVRLQGDWERWLEFFLQGIEETATDAADTAQRVHALRETHRRALEEAGGTLNDLALLDKLFSQPLVNANWVGTAIDVSPPTANAVLGRFEKAGILREITGGQRRRLFRYDGRSVSRSGLCSPTPWQSGDTSDLHVSSAGRAVIAALSNVGPSCNLLGQINERHSPTETLRGSLEPAH